ncbi:MAG TPA: hypothetical protein DEH22_06470 [Chloroflexi bacterium]|nr:hypothetical protein [Chloroflexota bacterium]
MPNNIAIPNDAQSVSVAIANLSVQLNCHHTQLAKVLNSRYQEFPAGQPANLNAEIRWVGNERHTALLDTEPKFSAGELKLCAPGYDGFINEKNGCGALTISSAQPVEEIDYYLRMAFALLAHAAGGVLLHAAGIVRDGQAYLFLGHSGSGKTTACRASQADHIILNDDLVLLLPETDHWQAYGTPFWNPTQVQPSAQSAPVAGIYLLVQSKQVFTRPITRGRGLAALISNVPVIPQDPLRSLRLFEILSQIQQITPVSELHFLPDNSFWNVIAP